MTSYWLEIKLESDTAPGRGDGVAGLVNAEVQHEPSGLPFLGGKTLKGLLAATCGEILHALVQSEAIGDWDNVAKTVFGQPGSQRASRGKLHVGGAYLPDDLRQAIAEDIVNSKMTREDVLDSITVMRRQTAMDAERGTPLDHTLRTIRVVLRETVFTARLDFLTSPIEDEIALLTACVQGLRRMGTNRNRGMGRVSCQLFKDEGKTDPVVVSLANKFRKQEVTA